MNNSRDYLLDVSGRFAAFYEREYYCFSNFSSFSVFWMGRLWQTSEHAYQAAKFFDAIQDVVEIIYNTRSAHKAYKIAHDLEPFFVIQSGKKRKFLLWKIFADTSAISMNMFEESF